MVRRIGVILAVCVLMASAAQAQTASDDVTKDERKTEKEAGGPTILKKLRAAQQPEQPAAAPEPAQEPEAAPAKPTKTTQMKSKRRKKTARKKPAPQATKTATQPSRKKKSADAEAQWWENTGNPHVFTFSDCVAGYTAEATRRGSKSSYPEFLTEAMNGQCKGQFESMAQVLLDRLGESGFRKIAKELIATTFIPAVKSAAERAQAETAAAAPARPSMDRAAAPAAPNVGQAAAPPAPTVATVQLLPEPKQKRDPKLSLEVELKQAKDAMLACFAAESDRLASTSNLAADRLVGPVIESCRGRAEVFFAKLHALYPDAAAGLAGKTEAVLDGSYRPAIVSRINSKRAAMLASGQ